MTFSSESALSASLSIPIAESTIHTGCTACPPALHSPQQLSTRCGCRRCRAPPTVRGVSQTPTYDQLRGERINADVPASEDKAPLVDQPGRHHPLNGAPGARAHSRSPKAAAHLAPAWSWFESVDSGPPGRHHLWEDAPNTAEIRGQSATPPAYQSRSEVVDNETGGSVIATQRDESGTDNQRQTSAVIPGSCDQGTPSPPGPQAALPPVAHARHTPAPRGKSSPAAAAVDKLKQDTAEAGRPAYPGQGYQVRSLSHTEARHLMPKALH
jgi:hypothetical protein